MNKFVFQKEISVIPKENKKQQFAFKQRILCGCKKYSKLWNPNLFWVGGDWWMIVLKATEVLFLNFDHAD